jgi:pimeloyl-ACP methyl ester carboxylesterase
MTKHELLSLISTARVCSLACQALYDGREEFADVAQLYDYKFRFGEVAYARLGVLFNDFHTLIIVNGSDPDPHDWLANLDARQSNYCGIKCHSGFADVCRMLAPEMRKMSIPDGRPVHVVGHSAGGAIAQLLAYSISGRLGIAGVITFGSPRVIASEHAPWYRALPWPVHRFVLGRDPVPLLPLRNFRVLFGGADYSHTCDPTYIDSKGRLSVDRSPIQSIARMGATALRYAALGIRGLPAVVADHHIAAYRAAILAAQDLYTTSEKMK